MYHLGNMLVSNDERLCQQNVITVSAVTRARRRIAYQACLKSGQLEPRRNPQLGIKRFFSTVSDDRNALKQTAPANVANMRVLTKSFEKGQVELCAHLCGARNQVFSFQLTQNGQR